MGYKVIRVWGYGRFGKECFDKFLEKIPDELAERIEVAETKDWYPARDAYRLFKLVKSDFGQEAFDDYALYLFKESVSGFLKGLASFINPASLSKRANSMWLRIHSHGKVEANVIDTNHVQYTISDWNVDKISCELFEIWIKELLMMTRAREVKIKEMNCVHDGDTFCRWDVKFTT